MDEQQRELVAFVNSRVEEVAGQIARAVVDSGCSVEIAALALFRVVMGVLPPSDLKDELSGFFDRYTVTVERAGNDGWLN